MRTRQEWGEGESAVEKSIFFLNKNSENCLLCDAMGTILYVGPETQGIYRLKALPVGKNVCDVTPRVGLFAAAVKALQSKENASLPFLSEDRPNQSHMCFAEWIPEEKKEPRYIVCYGKNSTDYARDVHYSSLLNRAVAEKAEKVWKKGAESGGLSVLETSQSMAHVYRIIERISRYDVSVCLTGESGVGKTYLARKIHNTSARRNEPFVVVNCAAIPPSLLETELFGYERGAYTGARSEGKMGLIELAHNGTLFLDEIGEMAADMQVKLLSALQEKKFMRVGGTKERSVNFRLITATNQDLVDLIQQGKFRKDLFYRLYVIPIRIPALRERREDITPLVLHYLEQFNHLYGVHRRFSEEALACLRAYDWPGNIRQLQNHVERSLLLSDGDVISYESIPNFVRQNRRETIMNAAEADPPKGRERDSASSGKDIQGEKAETTDAVREGATLKELLEEEERKIILRYYKQYGSPTKIAKQLGISQPSASMKLKKYLDTPSFPPAEGERP